MKFGGTSVGDADRVANAIDIVAERKHLQPIVVVSALAGVTNDLVAASEAARRKDATRAKEIIDAVRLRHEDVALHLVQHKSDFLESFLKQLHKHIDEINTILKGFALLGEITPRARDKVAAIGEKLSCVLFAYSMMMRMLPGESVDPEDVIVTDDNFCGATPKMDKTRVAAQQSLLHLLERRTIPVIGGFVGRSDVDGATTTLGRNGSDYSAAIIAAALGADEVQIWTDVDGLLTCDPRLVPGARVIDRLSFDEAAELAQFGAKLHPRTLEPAVEANIPVRVLNTHNPASPGTLITRSTDATSGPRSIARKRNIAMVHVASNRMLGTHGFLAQFFERFAELGISVDLVATSEVSVTVTVDEKHDMDALRERLRTIAENVEMYDAQCIVAVVGQNLMSDSRVGARVLDALQGIPVKMISLGRSGLNLSIVVDDANADQAVKAIHHALFEATVAA